MLKEIITNSEEETAKFAAEIAANTCPGKVFALHGSLGAGKSVFSRGFARGCGIKGPIPSPTFTIVQEYRIPEVEKTEIKFSSRLYHMDLYRIQDSEAAYSFGIDEYLDDKSAVKLIEWPERIEDILPEDTINVNIYHIAENKRKIVVSGI